MAFPRKLLNDDEQIVLDLRPHWMYFLEPALALISVAVVYIVVVAVFDDGWFEDAIQWLGGILLIALIPWTVIRYIKWSTINFVVTTDRVIYRSGVFAKSGIQIPLERVNNVIFRQSFWNRIFGAGDLIIESAGEDGRQVFNDVNHPDHVQNVIHREMDAAEDRKYDRMGRSARSVERSVSDLPPPPPAAASAASAAAAAPQAPPANVGEELERLEGLMQRGAITRDEFEAQKRRLLGA
jgi:uncharacterized membrane protein YdbT with pleckstrin-like domain